MRAGLIRFAAEGGGTLVELEHSGWELDIKARDSRQRYVEGWDTDLGHFRDSAAAA
jgi:hypothetical protein